MITPCAPWNLPIQWSATKRHFARIVPHSGCDAACQAKIHAEWVSYRLGLVKKAQGIAGQAAAYFWGQSRTGLTLNLGGSTIAPMKGTPTIGR